MINKDLIKRESELKMAWYIALKQNSPCIVCTEDHPSVIELHHKHPQDKVDTVLNLVKRNKPFREIALETHKCIPLCSNCHKKVHWNVIDLSFLYESNARDRLVVTFNSKVKGDRKIELTVGKDLSSLQRIPSIWVALRANQPV